MNTKITFLLLLVLLIILMLFYYIDLESNIIILLGVVIVLVIHNLITKQEHFTINEQASRLEAQIDSLTAVAEALKSKQNTSNTGSGVSESEHVTITKSCPYTPINRDNNDRPNLDATDEQIDGLGIGLSSSLNQLTASDIQGMFNQPESPSVSGQA